MTNPAACHLLTFSETRKKKQQKTNKQKKKKRTYNQIFPQQILMNQLFSTMTRFNSARNMSSFQGCICTHPFSNLALTSQLCHCYQLLENENCKWSLIKLDTPLHRTGCCSAPSHPQDLSEWIGHGGLNQNHSCQRWIEWQFAYQWKLMNALILYAFVWTILYISKVLDQNGGSWL